MEEVREILVCVSPSKPQEEIACTGNLSREQARSNMGLS